MKDSRVATDTAGTGSAGNVKISASNLLVDQSEISSATLPGSTGNGGSVEVLLADRLNLANGAIISTSTQGAGRAGSIDIRAGDVAVLGSSTSIQATAAVGSSGQTGNVNIIAARSVTLEDGATLSIQNDALQTDFSLARSSVDTVKPLGIVPGSLSIAAAGITIDGAQVGANSTGNIAASNLRFDASEGLTLRNASLTTTARGGDGGGINLAAGGMLTVDHSQVTTSVLGSESGNGGDIRLHAGTLLMDTGFIQANTAAPDAAGGNVNVDVGLLVTTGVLLLGGDQPFTFDPNLIGVNVIQAASPNGISGNVNVTGPIIDTAGNLRGLSAKPAENPALESDLCRRSARSTFTRVVNGGLRLSGSSWSRPEDLPTKSSYWLQPGSVVGFFQCR